VAPAAAAAPIAQPIVWQNEAAVGRILTALFPGFVFAHNSREQWNTNGWRDARTGRWVDGGLLELDYYCADLKLAVEYQGEQHYMAVERFDGTDPVAAARKLYGRRQRDRRKADNCAVNGVHLICVPYTEQTDAQKRDFILRALPDRLALFAARV
jgi:hypothetical protein